jgi:pseudaminic acid biosynthesis-associated methylase
MALTNPQEDFWKSKINLSYAQDNSRFDIDLGIRAWNRMLYRVDSLEINSYLDCGANIGRNIRFLKEILPLASSNIIEIASEPFEECKRSYKIDNSFFGSIKNAKFEEDFDLVFTSGVLIHINPQDLIETMANMFRLSSRYILICEYFNRTPTTINYKGESDRLFKRDFGKLFMENFDCKIIDYGFLWGQEFDDAGFDDTTYWLFEKSNKI